MKKIFTLIIIAVLMLNVAPARAQEITWNPVQNIKHCLFQLYVGDDEGITYVVAADRDLSSSRFNDEARISLLKYKPGFEEPEVIKLKIKSDLIRIESCFISADRKIFLMFKAGSGFNEYIMASIYDLGGNFEKSEDIFTNKTDPGKKMSVSSAHVFVSPNHQWFLAKYGTTLKLLDNQFKKIWEREYQQDPDYIKVLNDGAVMGNVNEEKSKMYKMFRIDKKNKLTEVKFKKATQVKYDSISGKMYAVTLNGETDKSVHLHGGKTYKGLLISPSFSYAVYSAADLKKEAEETDIHFTKEIIDAATDKKNEGLAGIEFQNIAATSDNGGPVFVFLTKYIYEGSDSRGTPMDDESIENIVLVKMKEKNLAEQKIISYIDKKSEAHDKMVAVGSVITADKISLIYNTYDDGKCDLHLLNYSKDLQETGNNIQSGHEMDLDLEKLNHLSDGSYLLLGRWKRDSGSAIVKF
jgi:hypothetical protein